MPFCRNCGTKMPDNSKFCANCGTAVIKTTTDTNNSIPNNQSVPFQPPTERLLTNDGLCYEYDRGQELDHFYPNTVRSKRYLKTIIYNVILILFLFFIIGVCKWSINDYLDEHPFITDKVEEEIESAEFWVNLCYLVIVILFVELAYYIIARELHKQNILHLCENGIYGKTTFFLVLKKFDLPYSKIDTATPYSRKGIFRDEFLIIHTRTLDLNINTGSVCNAVEEINKKLIK